MGESKLPGIDSPFLLGSKLKHEGPKMMRRWILPLLGMLIAGDISGEERIIARETFSTGDTSAFTTAIPNKNTEIRNGVLWTRGSSGGKYPPMVYLPVKGTDLEISFRYRFLEPGGMIWFFVDGDDGFGSVDHMLRFKLRPDRVQLQIDAHSLDPNHPMRQNTGRPADKVSGAFRLNEILPDEKVDLSEHEWRKVKLVFRGSEVLITIDDKRWRKTLIRPCFDDTKRKLLWMLNGGKKGIELDDIVVQSLDLENPWIPLFNQKDLTGWKANTDPGAFTVANGILTAHATHPENRGHLFAVEDDGRLARFKDFELVLEAKGAPKSNSGIFFHTDMETRDGKLHLKNGYEIQLNSTEKEKRKTGSLYDVLDLSESPVDETNWFQLRIRVEGKRIQAWINDKQTVDYHEPLNPARSPQRAGRLLTPHGGAIAIQAHDDKSTFHFRKIRIRRLHPDGE
ncbi:MAG: DUF1080 domain-containing protein [Verrucomicrobiales bacterium]|nr:DUF1080 domain-containing protein [Verrucomicrobiales bacterium]